MATFDISRSAFQPEKHYTSVRMQQGRVITDDDWNDNEHIGEEDKRRLTLDVIGPFGSPDTGFLIDNLRFNPGGAIDFDIHPGTMYLGGLRLEMESGPDGGFESYRLQKDWLQQPPDEDLAPNPEEMEEGAERFDLVYLQAWQQGVSAIEDEELFEVALGGPDTGARLRNMRRVRLFPNVGAADCAEAWQRLRDDWQKQGLGTANRQLNRVPEVRLTVSFTEMEEKDDLCSPNVAGGYLGAENQAIRVQLTSADTFTWGSDNASSLYRVQVATDRHTVTMLTLPKDQYHHPLSGQVVEILPWSAVLPNGQKIAAQRGHLSLVQTSYDKIEKKFTLQTALPAGFGSDWESRADHADLALPTEYFFLRIWNRGTDLNSEPELPFTPGWPVALGNTGLQIQIDGPDRVPGDYWILAARPETPNRIVPWSLESGLSPMGVHHFFAPLAVIRWARHNDEVIGEIIHDCRKTFRPLTDLESCCTFHVGDGVNSHGDFNSIEEAVRNLPAAGGKICVLPGEHRANVDIFNRRNICICGCGERSLVIPKEEELTRPIFYIASSRNICIEKLNLAHPSGTPVALYDRNRELPPSSDIYIAHNRIFSAQYGIYIEVDDTVRGNNNVFIGHNQIAMADVAESEVGIFCLADQVLIEGNKITAVQAAAQEDTEGNQAWPGVGVFDPTGAGSRSFYRKDFALAAYLQKINEYIQTIDQLPEGSAYQVIGGVQIGGGSERVRIRENDIIGGAGNGITFGHFPRLKREQATYIMAKREAAVKGYVRSGSMIDAYEEVVGEFRSFLYEISVENNRIKNMGLSGIGVVAFFDKNAENDGLLVQVEDLTIYRNSISGCAQTLPAEIPDRAAFGGIALCSCEMARIEENRIENNGVSYIDPVCGIYLMNGEDVEISRNRILNNGPRTTLAGENYGLSSRARLGIRGGIYIDLIFKRPFTEAILDEIQSDGVPAAKIHDNIVVQPLGQALFMMAFGPVSVSGNQFTSHEIDFRHPLSVIAGAVFILDIGISKDLLRVAITPSLLKLPRLDVVRETNPEAVAALQAMLLVMQYLPSGSVLFANNQTTLDLRNLEIDLCLSSQLIASLDDIAFSDNLSECKGLAFIRTTAENNALQPIDLVFCNTVLAGVTVRASDNRFQEGFTQVGLSMLSFGYWNTTVGNQSSNCLFTFGRREKFDNNLEQFLGLAECSHDRDLLGSDLMMDQPYKARYAASPDRTLVTNP